MIQANEIRIGNWVDDAFVGFTQVRGEDLANWGAINCLPIPLTPELLERCGFVKETSEDIEERTIYSIQVANNTSLYFDPHKDWMRNDYEVEWYLSHEWNNNHFKNDFWERPKYLHQLQNLYFSLTNTELDIQL